MIIFAPLPNVAVHIMQTPDIRPILLANAVRPGIGIVDEPGVVVEILRILSERIKRRRAGATAGDVINAMSFAELTKFIAARR